VLDPFHFSRPEVVYDALGLGLPIVTWPSSYMRGRIAYGCYRKMDVLDCVAADPEQYARIAVKLGTDRKYRDAVRADILAAADVLFEDIEAVRQFEQFFREAINARRG
jgi:predicted O-linked N-acetylglucosamine transferase (SPINDLY family)